MCYAAADHNRWHSIDRGGVSKGSHMGLIVFRALINEPFLTAAPLLLYGIRCSAVTGRLHFNYHDMEGFKCAT